MRSKLCASAKMSKARLLPDTLKNVASSTYLPDQTISRVVLSSVPEGSLRATCMTILRIVFLLIAPTALEVLTFLRDLFRRYSNTILACRETLSYREDLGLVGVKKWLQDLHWYLWYFLYRLPCLSRLKPFLVSCLESHLGQWFF